MRDHALPPLRAAWPLLVIVLLALAPTGCGSDSAAPVGKPGELPPEAINANKNMQDAMKNPPAPKAP